MYNYLILNPVAGAVFCTLQEIENMAEPLLLKKGARLEPWPADVRLHMDPNFPKALQLPDCVKNLPGAIVVSKRLKEFIAAAKPVHVEYLPVSIINHKGKLASSEYFIINPYKLQDCIDQKASTIDWNPIDTSLIAACTNLVLDEKKIEKNAKVFRLEHYPSKVLFARELADGIKQAKFTGLKFIEPEAMEY
jgi:hypothetical protein